MRSKGKLGLPLALLVGASAFATPIATADPSISDSESVEVDLDGDGKDDTATIRKVDDETHELVLERGSGSVMTYTFPGQNPPNTEPFTPRVTDVNRDGSDELIVATNIGANTLSFRMLGWRAGLGPVTVKGPDGASFEFYEGGGNAAVNRYSCQTTDYGHRFVTVSGTRVDDSGRLSGNQDWFQLDGIRLSKINTDEFVDAEPDDPRFEYKAETCDR